MTTLDKLLPGETGRVVKVEGTDGIAARLREMGLVPGRAIQLIRAAPLGDPLKCFVEGCRLALRTAEARRVSVQLDK